MIFSITSLEELAATVSDTMATTTLLLGAIAAISLLVGGIGRDEYHARLRIGENQGR